MRKTVTTLLLSLLCTGAFSQPLLVGHRGCRNIPGVDENSIASLKYAQDVPVDYVEFDVNLTADDRIIVFHGPKVPGLNKDIRDITFDEARSVVLPGGSKMPTLEEWFAQVRKHPEIKVVMEIKRNYNHDRDRLAVQLAMKEVKSLKVEHLLAYTTFSKTMCKEIHKIDPAAKVIFLQSGDSPMKAKEAKELGYNGISYDLNGWLNNPSIAAQAKESGIETTLWLANDNGVIDWAIRHNIDCISADDPAKARQYLKSVQTK